MLRRPLVRVGGKNAQLPVGDVLVGVARTVGATFDGGGQPLVVGAYCDVRLPFRVYLDKVSVVADTNGSLIVDIRRAPLEDYPPTVSIAASAKPTLVSARTYEDTDLAGWTTELQAGDVVRFVVESCSGITRATIQVEGVQQ